MSLTQTDKENLLILLDKANNFEDLKLVIRTLIVLEDFVVKYDKFKSSYDQYEKAIKEIKNKKLFRNTNHI